MAARIAPAAPPLDEKTRITQYLSDPGNHIAIAALSDKVASQLGSPVPDHLLYATSVILGLPEVIRNESRDPVGARAVLLALLIDRKNPDVREKQLAYLLGHENNSVYLHTQKMFAVVSQLLPQIRLPLIELAIPALHTISPQQYELFRNSIQSLILADHRIDAFEFSLKQVVCHHLDQAFGLSKPAQVKFSTLDAIWQDSVDWLSYLSYIGFADPDNAGPVFQNALKSLDPARQAELTPAAGLGMERIETILEKLNASSPEIKGLLMKASLAAIQHDGVVTPEEAELLRAFASTLDCPIPPFL